MNNRLYNILHDVFVKSWQKRLVIKISLLMWLLILFTVGTYALFSVPFQKSLLVERMNIEAHDVASSFMHANASAIITDDHQLVVDYSMNMLKTSNSIDYIVIAKKDGKFNLVFESEGWNTQDLKSFWIKPDQLVNGAIITSQFTNEETYHLAKQFLYSGIDWGYVHVGLSMQNYNKAVEDFNARTLILALMVTILSLITSVLFSKRITKPIIQLADTAKKIEAGNLSARVQINSYDEIGNLAISFNKMTEAVSKSKDELEAKVIERTVELNSANKNLLMEVDEKEKAQTILSKYTGKLEILEEVYKKIISSNSKEEIIFETMKYLNVKLLSFTRSGASIYNENSTAVLYKYKQMEGLPKFDISEFPISNFGSIEKLKKKNYFIVEDLSLKNDKSAMEEIIFQEGRMSYICLGLESHGELIGEFNFAFDEPRQFEEETISILSEVCNQISVAIVQMELEEKLQKHADKLQESLKEKEILLKEVHHRVKNNLQIINSLLFLQAAKIKDPEILTYYKDSQNRVRSLALIHEKLYKSKDLAEIDFADYLKSLSNNLYSSFKTTSGIFKINYDLDELALSIDTAIPLGLIVNELLSNSFKYAFNSKHDNENTENIINIKLKKIENQKRLLSISDNGVGLPENFEAKTENSLGIKLIHSLVSQIDGELVINPRDNTEFKITF